MQPILRSTRIYYVYDPVTCRKYETDSYTPEIHKLANFDVEIGTTYLVLDDYGNDVIPYDLQEKLFAQSLSCEYFTLAIAKQTGEIFLAYFVFDDERKLSINLADLYPNSDTRPKVPPVYLASIDSLKNKKRPFSLELPGQAVIRYMDRDISIKDLQQEVIIELHYEPKLLQIWGDRYRAVEKWEKS